jgi:hypothetical protein
MDQLRTSSTNLSNCILYLQDQHLALEKQRSAKSNLNDSSFEPILLLHILDFDVIFPLTVDQLGTTSWKIVQN